MKTLFIALTLALVACKSRLPPMEYRGLPEGPKMCSYTPTTEYKPHSEPYEAHCVVGGRAYMCMTPSRDDLRALPDGATPVAVCAPLNSAATIEAP